MMLPYGTNVRSTMSHNPERGMIVGFGTIMWPTSANIGGDGGTPYPVYLVQIADGSGYDRSACVVLRADRVEVEE
jgi:hypothetical protein